MREKSLYKILIDTRNRDCRSVSLFKGDVVLAERVGDIDIVPAIKDLLERAKLRVSDISEFGPHPGPGSFTGLKIGYTVANILNWVNGRELSEVKIPDYGGEPNISVGKKQG